MAPFRKLNLGTVTPHIVPYQTWLIDEQQGRSKLPNSTIESSTESTPLVVLVVAKNKFLWRPGAAWRGLHS